MYEINREYSPCDMLTTGSSLVYDDANVQLFGTDLGFHLFGQTDQAPSWWSDAPHVIPYLGSPEHLHWYSRSNAWKTSAFFGPDGYTYRISPLLRSIQLFARRAGTGMFWYLGTGNIVGFGAGGPADPQCFRMRYHIVPKLSRRTWEALGGYVGWLVVLGGRDYTSLLPDVVASLIDSHWGRDSSYLHLTRYDGDVLNASITQSGQATLSYRQHPTSPTLFSGSYDESGEWSRFPHENEEAWEAPISTVIDRDDALRIIRTYLSTGYPIGLSPAE